MVQLWVNLPAKDKMSRPKYQDVKQSEMAKFYLPDDTGTIEIIAGNFEGKKGSIATFTPIEMYNARLNKGAKVSFNFPKDFNTALVVIDGNVKVNDLDIATADQMVHFKNDGELITIEALANAVVLVLSGEPINEPIAAYGPFLMNNNEEIQQAIADYNEGRFGYLEE